MYKCIICLLLDSCGYKICLFIFIINCIYFKFKCLIYIIKMYDLSKKMKKKMNDLKRMKRKIFNKLCMLY